jgi:hypothetical protein
LVKKGKLIAGILVFGSVWGFAEIVIGDLLRKADLPAGAILTGVFALGLLLLSRMTFKVRGMQLGMGLVAGLLRLFNPISASHICSAIAIMAEGLVFEILYPLLTSTEDDQSQLVVKVSSGVILSYGIYVTGYIVSQILTAVVSSAGFHPQNLFPYLPVIFASGLLAAVIGGVVAPLVFLLRGFDVRKIKEGVYYPLSAIISALCWVAVFTL